MFKIIFRQIVPLLPQVSAGLEAPLSPSLGAGVKGSIPVKKPSIFLTQVVNPLVFSGLQGSHVVETSISLSGIRIEHGWFEVRFFKGFHLIFSCRFPVLNKFPILDSQDDRTQSHIRLK